MSYWRHKARDVIQARVKEIGRDAPDLKAKLSEVYPFVERKYWPYKVWLDEVRKATGRPKDKAPTLWE